MERTFFAPIIICIIVIIIAYLLNYFYVFLGLYVYIFILGQAPIAANKIVGLAGESPVLAIYPFQPSRYIRHAGR